MFFDSVYAREAAVPFWYRNVVMICGCADVISRAFELQNLTTGSGSEFA
jgi:hypothetical protein